MADPSAAFFSKLVDLTPKLVSIWVKQLGATDLAQLFGYFFALRSATPNLHLRNNTLYVWDDERFGIPISAIVMPELVPMLNLVLWKQSGVENARLSLSEFKYNSVFDSKSFVHGCIQHLEQRTLESCVTHTETVKKGLESLCT